ncbi:MAG: hypothetical protein R3B70_14565 [Polyangiaceae bacterium]
MIPRVYRAAHNVGRYRFVECAALDRRGVPIGDITAYGDVLFQMIRCCARSSISGASRSAA